MKKYKDIYKNRIPEILNEPWKRDQIRRRLGDRVSNLDLFRWSSNAYYPPIYALFAISEVSNMSTSYLVGQTDILHKPDNPNGNPRDIKEFLNKKRISSKDLAKRLGSNLETANGIIKSFPDIRTNSLIALSDALGVSTDYLLGLTERETWNDDLLHITDIVPGHPAFVVAADPAKSQYILVASAGDTVFFADGTEKILEDEFWSDITVIPLVNNSTSEV